MTHKKNRASTKNQSDVAFLVLSCDRYSDLWPIFFESMRRYVPEIGLPVYLGSNTLHCEGVRTILSGEDKDWSTSLISILSQLSERTVLLWLEDLLFTEEANQNKLNRTIEYFKRNNLLHMHMQPAPAPDRLDGEEFGIYDGGRPYRVNVLGLWNREYLMKLLIPGESPWNFEIMGSYRSSYSDGFACVLDSGLHWVNAVEKGQWFPGAVDKMKSLGFQPDTSSRSVLAGSRRWKSLLQIAIFKAIARIPWKTRVAWMNQLRRLLISY